ncbi:trace amine-associated receptor 3-like [Pelobates fuscus]|uniref:trace amine-associated receptor 3-like n=1 Tax=Pelobates fuscus TaxID=191477 RepID=UPI002FE46034
MDIIMNPICAQYNNSSLPCSDKRPVGVRLGLYMFLTCSITITIIGNLGLIISIAHFKQLHSPTNFLILSLAVADMSLGLFIMPYSMLRTVENCWYFGSLFCKIHYGCDLMLSVVSIFHLCTIAIDRFYAVCDPLHYHTKITVAIIKKTIFFCWSAPVAFSFGVVATNMHASGVEGYEILVKCFSLCPITFNKLWSFVVFFTCFFAPGSVMAGIYIKIFLVSQRHVKLLQKISGNMSDVSSAISKKEDRKAAKKLGILMCVFLACWLPLFLTFLIDQFSNFSTPGTVFEVLNWFSYINSTCNPILYGFLYPWFRKAMKHFISGQICFNDSSTIDLFRQG